jgi:hypothetical protein
MSKFLTIVILVVLTVAVGPAEAGNPVAVASDGWTVTAYPEQGVLKITHDRFGTVMNDVRLNVGGEDGLNSLRNWSAEKKGQRRLSIKTDQPRTGWTFELGQDTLKISSTSTATVLTAEVPASTDRLVARVLDPQGVPVDWVGTNEVANSYGGSETRNPSFLPRRNPDCITFALGQVSSSNLYSLFDRKTDTVISFSEQALMQRDSQNPDLLDVSIPVPGGTLVRLIPDYYTKTLHVPYYVPFDDSYISKAPMVWSSWTSYYEDVNEEDMVRNTDWIAQNLKPYGFEYVQLDDGYDRGSKGEHYWIEKWDQAKFPHGPQWLANYIKSRGLRPGIWIVPNAYAGAVEQHPDWYLRHQDGRIILDYRTPSLDSTNPEVLAFLKKEFTILDDWGFEYYKFDGEHAIPRYVPSVDKDRLHDRSIDPLVAYRNRLKLIRETIGPRRFIEGCPAGTPLNGIGYFNSYFTGHDLYNSWQGMYALFSSINANAFLNHMVVYVMPGEGIELLPPMTVEEATRKRDRRVVETARTREDPMKGFGTTMAEARTVVTYVSLTGVAYPVASVMPELPEERVELLKKTLPTMPILPVDLFSRGTDMQWDIFKHTTPDDYIHNYPEILDLKVNAKSGVYDVVGLTNWRSGTATRELSFTDKLGLSAGSRYIAFDFWGQKLLGVYQGRMRVQIEPHDTRVLLMHPFLNRPQLIGISRHITGAYSVLDLAWDAAKDQLRGSSETVPGEAYTLFVYVPDGATVSQVRAATKGAREVPVRPELTGNSLMISFQGQQEVVDWQVKFTTSAGK